MVGVCKPLIVGIGELLVVGVGESPLSVAVRDPLLTGRVSGCKTGQASADVSTGR